MPTIPLYFANELPSSGGINQDASAPIVRGLDKLDDALGTLGARWQKEVDDRKKAIAAHDKAIEDARRESELIRRGEEMQTAGNEELTRLMLENPGNSQAVKDGIAEWSKNYQDASLRYVEDPLLLARLGGKLATVGGGIEVQGVNHYRNEAPKEIKLNAEMAMKSAMQNSVTTVINQANVSTMTPSQVASAIKDGMGTTLAAVNSSTGPGFSPDELTKFNMSAQDEWLAQHIAAYAIYASPEQVETLVKELVSEFSDQKIGYKYASQAVLRANQAERDREVEAQRRLQQEFGKVRLGVFQGGQISEEQLQRFTPEQQRLLRLEANSRTVRQNAEAHQSSAADNRVASNLVGVVTTYDSQLKGFLTKTPQGFLRAPRTPGERLNQAETARDTTLRVLGASDELGATAEELHIAKLLKSSGGVARSALGLAVGGIDPSFNRGLVRVHAFARISTFPVPAEYGNSPISRQRYREALQVGFDLALASRVAGLVAATKGSARPADIARYYFSPTEAVPSSLAKTEGFKHTRDEDYRFALQAGKQYAAQIMGVRRPGAD